MNKILLSLGILLASSTLNIADEKIPHVGRLSPLHMGVNETDTIFSNPAELTFHNRVFEVRATYESREESMNGMIIMHLPDNTYAFGNNKWDWGDLAFTYEAFGSDFFNNFTWINDNSDEGGSFQLFESGSRMAATWAKRTRFITIGANLKYYDFEVLNGVSGDRDAFGADVGLYFTPFEDLYMGIVAKDLGGTDIRDSDNDVVSTIDEDVRIMLAVMSGNDMSFSVGVPTDIFEQFDETDDAWKQITFHGRKVFSDTFETAIGLNTRDAYLHLGFHINKYFSMGITGMRNLYDSDESGFSISMTLGIPAHERAMEPKTPVVTPQPLPAVAPPRAPRPAETRPGYRKSRKQIREERRELKEDILEKRQDLREEIEEDEFKELENALDDKIDELKLKKLQRRQEQLRELQDDLDNEI